MSKRFRILILEDNQYLVETIKTILGKKYDCIFRSEAKLSRATQINFQAFDLCLCDLNLKGKSAVELCREIASQISVIVLSGYLDSGVIEKLLGSKIDDFLTKPLNEFELLERVKSQLGLRGIIRLSESSESYIDPITKKLIFNRQKIPISESETRLLNLITSGKEVIKSASIKMKVTRINKKTMHATGEKLIKSRYGGGYYF